MSIPIDWGARVTNGWQKLSVLLSGAAFLMMGYMFLEMRRTQGPPRAEAPPAAPPPTREKAPPAPPASGVVAVPQLAGKNYVRFELGEPALTVAPAGDGRLAIVNADPALAGRTIKAKGFTADGAMAEFDFVVPGSAK